MPNLDEATHIHEFNRIPFYVKHGINFRREWRWKCQNPDCNAIWKRFQVKDKRSVCSVCHENTLILDNDALKRAKPRCTNCSMTRESIEKREAKRTVQGFVSQLLDIDKPETREEIEENDFLSNMYKDD